MPAGPPCPWESQGWDARAALRLSITWITDTGAGQKEQALLHKPSTLYYRNWTYEHEAQSKKKINKDFLVLLNYRALNFQQNVNSPWVRELRVTRPVLEGRRYVKVSHLSRIFSRILGNKVSVAHKCCSLQCIRDRHLQTGMAFLSSHRHQKCRNI